MIAVFGGAVEKDIVNAAINRYKVMHINGQVGIQVSIVNETALHIPVLLDTHSSTYLPILSFHFLNSLIFTKLGYGPKELP